MFKSTWSLKSLIPKSAVTIVEFDVKRLEKLVNFEISDSMALEVQKMANFLNQLKEPSQITNKITENSLKIDKISDDTRPDEPMQDIRSLPNVVGRYFKIK